jgi:hypothetical protein
MARLGYQLERVLDQKLFFLNSQYAQDSSCHGGLTKLTGDDLNPVLHVNGSNVETECITREPGDVSK